MDRWKTIHSESLVDTRWVKVRKDAVDLPNGQHIDDFYVITLNEAAAIVALDDDGNIILKKERCLRLFSVKLMAEKVPSLALMCRRKKTKRKLTHTGSVLCLKNRKHPGIVTAVRQKEQIPR